MVLLIDEAQDLVRELLEEVRLLSNLETDDRKLLQIVLIGQPELRDKLDRAGAAPAPPAHHGALPPRRRSTATETEALHRAPPRASPARDGRPEFSAWAVRAIHRYSARRAAPDQRGLRQGAALRLRRRDRRAQVARTCAGRSASSKGRSREPDRRGAEARAGGGPAREEQRREARPWIPTPLPDAGLARRRRIVRRSRGRSSPRRPSLGRAVSGNRARRCRRGHPRPRRTSRGGPAAAPPARTRADGDLATTPVAPRRRPARRASPAGRDARRTRASSRRHRRPPPGPPRTIADGRSYVGSVDLPGGGRIELGGIVWSEIEPRALLNDRIVGVGAYVEGFTVSKIEEDRVALEKDGVTIFISLK